MILCQMDIKLLRREHGHRKGFWYSWCHFNVAFYPHSSGFLIIFMSLKSNSFFLELEPKVFCYTFLFIDISVHSGRNICTQGLLYVRNGDVSWFYVATDFFEDFFFKFDFSRFWFDWKTVSSFRGMHVSPAKHSYAWLPLESVTTGQTHRRTAPVGARGLSRECVFRIPMRVIKGD